MSTPPLDDRSARDLEKAFQAKLCLFRLTQFESVLNFELPNDLVSMLRPRMRQMARALVAPLRGEEAFTSELLRILVEQDSAAQLDDSWEPEWVAAEALFRLCHPSNGDPVPQKVLVGTVAHKATDVLAERGERLVIGARQMGHILRSLGFRTESLGSSGRGLSFTAKTIAQVHEIAQKLKIDRRTIASPPALRAGEGGVHCALCDEKGLSADLRYRVFHCRRRGASIFDQPDEVAEEVDGQ